MPNKTCFVVMGFGTKTDYTKPKAFNLDKTYRNGGRQPRLHFCKRFEAARAG